MSNKPETKLTRRAFVAGSAGVAATLAVRPTLAAGKTLNVLSHKVHQTVLGSGDGGKEIRKREGLGGHDDSRSVGGYGRNGGSRMVRSRGVDDREPVPREALGARGPRHHRHVLTGALQHAR